jgi:hypothetical protein
LAGAISLLSVQPAAGPDEAEARLAMLIELLQECRALLVLDNLETLLEPGALTPRYRDGYAGYGRILQRLGEDQT